MPSFKHTFCKTLILLFFIQGILISCSTKDSKGKKLTYQAVHNGDTAVLHLTAIDSSFYGQLERSHINLGKDSGYVRGKISGDTLQGDYYFKPFDTDKRERMPVAFLKKNNQLILGKGAIMIYLKIPYFDKKVPIDYTNPEFVFEKVNADKQLKLN